MIKRQNILILATMVALGLSQYAMAQDTPSVDEIVKKTNHQAYYQGKDGKARVKMTITDKKGRTRSKEFTILRMDADDAGSEAKSEDAGQKFYVYFHEPADERGTVFMVHKHLDRDDDRWLYLPALDVVKQIAASDERTSFVGSHFFYEDVSGRSIDEDEHELTEVTDTYYILKNTPKKPETVEFDSYSMWIHKATFIPIQVQFEKGGQVYRSVKALKVEDIKGADGTVYKTVTRSQMDDTNIGGNTLLEYTEVKYDIGLKDDLFTERYLRNAPREYLE